MMRVGDVHHWGVAWWSVGVGSQSLEWWWTIGCRCLWGWSCLGVGTWSRCGHCHLRGTKRRSSASLWCRWVSDRKWDRRRRHVICVVLTRRMFSKRMTRCPKRGGTVDRRTIWRLGKRAMLLLGVEQLDQFLECGIGSLLLLSLRFNVPLLSLAAGTIRF